MDPILKHHFNNFKNSFEIVTSGSSPDEEKAREAKAFEKFVNYMLFSLDYPDVFTGNIELLDFICVGGGNDTGVDGIGIKVNERIVRSKEDVKEIAETSRKLVVEFVFIQSKLRQGIDIGEFSKFTLGIKNFFSDGYLPENQHIKDIRDIKDFIYSDHNIISKLDNTPCLYVYYVTTGSEASDDRNFIGAQRALQDDLQRGNFYFETVSIEHVGGKQLVKFCRELENRFEVMFEIMDIFPLIANLKTKEDIKKAYTFTCKATEFLKILTKEDGQLRRSLFNSNVRDYLGNKGPVNKEIEQTIAENPEMFLLCNNGVTIVCSDFEQVRDKLVKLEDPQIVNGCQTSNSVFNLRDNPNIEKVQILVRVISTENLGIANKIVRGTNKQNLVLDEAFEATLPFHQDVLEPFFLSVGSELKIYYERRAKQYNDDPFIKRTQVVNLRIVTQTFVAMFLNMPHESHRHEAKLLEEYGGDDRAKRRIFIEDHEPALYYACALTWYMFERYFREELIDSKYKAFKSHLYFIFRNGAGSLPPTFKVGSKAVRSYCEKLTQLLSVQYFDEQLQNTLAIFDDAQETWLSRGKSHHGIKDNKEFTDLLIEIIRPTITQHKVVKDVEEKPTVYEGRVINIIWRDGKWFGFIKRGNYEDNLYFDSRGHKGDPSKLTYYTQVRYEIGHNQQGDMAINVELVD
ncbi:MAG: AIPR family protein [Candidatus Latescibacterota bacterium]